MRFAVTYLRKSAVNCIWRYAPCALLFFLCAFSRIVVFPILEVWSVVFHSFNGWGCLEKDILYFVELCRLTLKLTWHIWAQRICDHVEHLVMCWLTSTPAFYALYSLTLIRHLSVREIIASKHQMALQSCLYHGSITHLKWRYGLATQMSVTLTTFGLGQHVAWSFLSDRG